MQRKEGKVPHVNSWLCHVNSPDFGNHIRYRARTGPQTLSEQGGSIKESKGAWLAVAKSSR